MTTWTPEQLDALASALLPTAVGLVTQVRDRDAIAVDEAIGDMEPMQLRTLVVVLASMVPDDAHMDDLIAWTRKPWELTPISPERGARNRADLARAEGVRDTYQQGAA